MDIINYMFDIRENSNTVDILNYKKQRLDIMLKDFFKMEQQYKQNQKFIYNSRLPYNITYFHSQITTYISKVWSNISYLNDSIEHKKNIDKLYSEIIKKDKNYTHPLMKKPNHTHNKIPELKTIYACSFLILTVLCIICYLIIYSATRSIVTQFRSYSTFTYLIARIIIVISVFYCFLGSYYYLFDIIWWILKAIFNLFIWILKAIIQIILFVLISIVHIFKFLIMGSILIGSSLYQICAIILKFIVAIPTTIDNIIKFGDASLVMDEINFDLDLSFSMDSYGLGFLDSIDTWLSFDWIISILGSGTEFLKDFGQSLTNTTNDYKNFLLNVNNDLKPTNDETANNKLHEEQFKSISQCANTSFLQKMIISANQDKQHLLEDREKDEKQSGKQTFIKCISS